MSELTLNSHWVWKLKKGIIGRQTWRNEAGWITITDVIISPNRNAYAVILEDGSMIDMTSYCDLRIK